VIHEPFTLLSCPAHPRTTLDLEGCAEKALLKSDQAIDARVKTIWTLAPIEGRAAFARGETSWLAYRRSNCTGQASKYSGGSEQPVAYLECEIARNRGHLADLDQMVATLRRH
jgi:uncharacterized protein YecT (DUF1311 family)